jgi:integrase
MYELHRLGWNSFQQLCLTIAREILGQTVQSFLDSNDGGRDGGERSQRDHYWKPALKHLGIRWRRAYNTRHTYATVALMAGVPPAYIASQLGNSVKMLLDRYARWIPGGDQGNARALLVAAMTSDPEGIRPKFVPTGTLGAPPETKKPKQINDLLGLVIGRRDWTRTNDPHHVKVVL